MRKWTCFIWLLWLPAAQTLWAQEMKMDSLMEVAKTAPEDTNKINLYWKAGAAVIYQDPTQALLHFKKGIALARKLAYVPGIERCYTGASLAFSLHAKYDSALLYIDTGVVYARKAGNPARLALVYLNRADVYQNLQNLSAALKNCDTALKYAEQINNKNGLGRIYSVMSDICVSQKEYSHALTYLDKADAYLIETGNRQMLGMNAYGKGEIYLEMNQPDKAVPFFKKAIQIADSVQDLQNLSSSYSYLAQIYREKEKYPEAETMARQALRYAQQTGNHTQEGVIYEVFSKIYMARHEYAKAIEEGLKAYAIMKEEKDLLREHETVTTLSEAYGKAGNTAKAYKYLKISAALNDSLIKRQNKDETAKLMTTFHVSQKDKEILLLNKDKELQQQKLKQQWLLTVGASAVAMLALIGIGLSINRYRLRQRMKELELRNRIAADLHDEVGSSLSSIHMLSQVAAQHPVHDAAHTDILSRVSTNARETMEKMGDIVWMIKPGDNEGVSLTQRMERYTYEMCSSQNIGFSTEGAEVLQTVKLSMQQRKNFYLIFKEALNNAVKYSTTEKVDIRIALQNHQLKLLIQDYGKGFVVNGNGNSNGNGLSNMQNRARELGGQLNIDSVIGQGTLVSLTFSI
jgi:two-component system, NarL family, sensor histidine kinase UhpB